MPKEKSGQRLQRLREQAGVSQPRLAAASGVPVGTLRGWEQGRRVPRLDTAVAVARALGIPLDELVGDTLDAAPKRRGKK
jgi:transcriptional regulator with XRE-family HTH domain